MRRFLPGTGVATSISKDYVDIRIVTPYVVLAGLLGAMIWNLITWWLGLPTSSSHALIGGYAGASVAKAGMHALVRGKWLTTISFIALSPLIGMALAYLLMLAVHWIFRRTPPFRADKYFRRLQLLSSALFSCAHGTNDAQKTMGIITALLISVGYQKDAHIRPWVIALASTAISPGTLSGGWRIVKTMGSRLTRLKPRSGFCAETGAAISIFFPTLLVPHTARFAGFNQTRHRGCVRGSRFGKPGESLPLERGRRNPVGMGLNHPLFCFCGVSLLPDYPDGIQQGLIFRGVLGPLTSFGSALYHVNTMRAFLFCLLLLLFGSPGLILAEVDPSWTTPIAPFRIADSLYYVGSQDLASYLVVTPKGNILINPNLATSPSQIRASVEALGFRWNDTKILLNSQAHYDHAAGAGEVIRETHAKNMVMDGDVSVVETGARADFLSPSPNILTYAPVHVDRVLHDGDTVSLGGVTLTARKTGGHTRGCTTWTMLSHLPGEPAETMRNIVIVGGTSFWSEYHFAASPGHPVSYPGIVQDFQHTFVVLRGLRCDVFLGAHGGYFDMLTKLKHYSRDGPRVFIDPHGYKEFVAVAQETFEKALSKQQTAAVH